MHEYEIFIEEINPCGGEKYSKKTLIEVVIVTGDNQGSFVRYTFTE